MSSGEHTHRDDSWACPDDEYWFAHTLKEIHFLVDICNALHSHTYIIADDYLLKTTEVNTIKLKLARAVRNSATIRDWFLDIIALERTEIIGHEVQIVSNLASKICSDITTSQIANQKLNHQNHIGENVPNVSLIVIPADDKAFNKAREHAIYVIKEFMDHAGYDCIREDYYSNE